jgi:hypothetical protein
MKRINSILALLLLGMTVVFAQDVQELYDRAREALSSGDYELAATLINEAKSDISRDPQLDPNHVFANRLLPQVEKNAGVMAEMVKALNELYTSTQSSIYFPDQVPSPESVRLNNQLAKQISSDLLSRRDEIMDRYDLAAEYRNALARLPIYRQIDQLASAGVMDKVAEKYEQMATVLLDSLTAVDRRYRKIEERLAKAMKSAAASRAQVQTMSQELANLSQERLNYISSISEMLAGESSSEQPKLPLTLNGNQIENVFANTIQTEINRLRSMTKVDSATYKELLHNYNRIESYSRIFAKNKIAGDQTQLMAQYKQALAAIQVQTPKPKGQYGAAFLLIGLLLLILAVIMIAAIKRRSARPPSSLTP